MEGLQVDHVEVAEEIDGPREPESNRPVVAAAARRSWREALIHEIRTHPFGYGVLAVALIAGPILLRMIFPEVTLVQSIVGGLAFGVYLALCAVPQKFM
jgi:hypothetical protein